MKEFFLHVLRDYAKRFWLFFLILYAATAIYELLRQVMLEGLASRWILQDPLVLQSGVVAREFFSNPLYIVIYIGTLAFSLWGFAALYLVFGGATLGGSVAHGLKNIPRYAVFIFAGGLITMIGFLILTLPVLFLLDQFTDIPLFLADNETLNYSIVLPLALFLSIPGIYILVALSNGPFILLLERRGVLSSLLESYRRVSRVWTKTALTLFITLLISMGAYALFSWIIFSLKLAFISDLSFRGESLLRVFLYSIPWVITASFFDLTLYHIYLRIRRGFETQPAELEKPANVVYPGKPMWPFSSVRLTKATALITLIAFTAIFVIAPAPVQAGGGGGLVGWLGMTILGIVAIAVCYGVCAPAVVAFLTTYEVAITTISTVLSGISFVGTPILGEAMCSGSYDPIFGTCTKHSQETQEVLNTAGAKFAKFTLSGIPTPEDFIKDPDAKEKVTIEWVSVGRPGTINNMRVRDKVTGQILCKSSETDITGADRSCSSGNMTNICQLSYDKEYVAEIIFASCWQVAAKEVRPTCSGCGWDAVGAKKEFSSSKIPVPGVDIKADGKDGNVVFTPGKPIKLTWNSEYGLSAEAQGSWSGAKPTSGSETVIPKTGNEVYTIVVRRGDKSGSDSVSSAPAVKTIKIFGDTSGGAGGAGGGGKLNISLFNVTEPLNPGDTVTVSWSVQGATSCTVDNGIGSVPTVGTAQLTFLKTVTLTLTCRDNGNTVSAQKTIKVKKPPGFKEILPE